MGTPKANKINKTKTKSQNNPTAKRYKEIFNGCRESKNQIPTNKTNKVTGGQK